MPSPSRLLKDIGGVTQAADVTRCRYDDFGRAASLVPILAKPLGVARIDAGSDALPLQFVLNPPVDRGKIIALVQGRRDLRFSGQDRLRLERGFPTLAERSACIRDILRALG